MATSSTSFEPQVPEIPVIGIVGGVGSGKSSVARKLAELVPAAIIDADKLGHQALELPAVKENLRRRFGEAIFDGDGAVVRSRLAGIVFGDSQDAVAARADLDAITHPEIGRMAREQIEAARASKNVRWILVDAALLLEAGWDRFCDAVAFIDVTAERRADRVFRQRGWSADEWRRREASQWPVERKRNESEIVVSNNGSPESAAEELRLALEKRFSSNMNR
jgi:dephospho-CoA kinase